MILCFFIKVSILNHSGYNIVIVVHKKNQQRDYWSYWGTKGQANSFIHDEQYYSYFKLFKLFMKGL